VVKNEESQPPKRFNDASLLTAMETAGTTLEERELELACVIVVWEHQLCGLRFLGRCCIAGMPSGRAKLWSRRFVGLLLVFAISDVECTLGKATQPCSLVVQR